jgi:hypothetical protein
MTPAVNFADAARKAPARYTTRSALDAGKMPVFNLG